jgi:hypothetical protein
LAGLAATAVHAATICWKTDADIRRCRLSGSAAGPACDPVHKFTPDQPSTSSKRLVAQSAIAREAAVKQQAASRKFADVVALIGSDATAKEDVSDTTRNSVRGDNVLQSRETCPTPD